MKPADLVIERFGGVRALAAEIDVNPSTVSRWRKPKDGRGSGVNGCDGMIPRWHHDGIMSAARRLKIRLTWAEVEGGK